jgi:hypothetical protein
MAITDKTWRLSASIYRTLVAAQTVAWAVIAFGKVLTRGTHAVAAPHPMAIALTMVAALCVLCGLVAYARRGRIGSYNKEAIVSAWACAQGAGLLALAGYVIAGETFAFVTGVATLALMHLFSPNRLEDSH